MLKTKTYDNGYYYGNLKDDKRSGHGIMTYYYGDKEKYEGEWLDDKMCGHGKMTYKQGNITSYEGSWLDNKNMELVK